RRRHDGGDVDGFAGQFGADVGQGSGLVFGLDQQLCNARHVCLQSEAQECSTSAGVSQLRTPLEAWCSAADNCSGSLTGGWQVKLEHTTATGLPAFTSGRLGMVSASAGGRFCGVASFSPGIHSTDLPSANGAMAAA